MNRVFIFILLLFFFCVAKSQTQQGIVKTRGRIVNGKVVSGQRLTGTTITLNIGNPLVSGQNGAFSFNVPTGKNYSLVMAKKQGYTLADPEYTRRSFKYSASNPFYVVLEDEAQRQADVNAATRKVRRTLTAQLQKREDEIEALKEQNKLTEAKYQKRLRELYDYQSKSEQLVKEMAERYASTDYDQLDEFNRQVQMYIEEGELQKADSMIRSKGDMNQRVMEYHNVISSNKKMRKELEQSESGAIKTYADLSQDLHRRSEIFMQAFQQDSAMYCLKLRADLDTTVIDAVSDYATLALAQKELESAIKYFNICLHSYLEKEILDQAAVIFINLGNCHLQLNDFTKAEEYENHALTILTALAAGNPDKYKYNEYKAQNNLAYTYIKNQNYELAEKHFKLSLDAITNVYALDDSPGIKKDLANTINNIGTLYRYKQNYEKAKEYFHKALTLKEELVLCDSLSFRPDLALAQTTLDVIYFDTDNFETSIKYYSDAIRNYEILAKQNPSAFLADLALVQHQIAPAYAELSRFDKAENYMLSSLNIYSRLITRNADIHRPYYVNLIISLAYLYK